MTQFSEQSSCSASEQRSIISSQRQKPRLRFWLFLLGGSILLHLLLIRWISAVIQPSLQPRTAMPIDLIHLSQSPEPTGHVKKSSQLQPLSQSVASPKPRPAKPVRAAPAPPQPRYNPDSKQIPQAVAQPIPSATVSRQFANLLPSASQAISPAPSPSPALPSPAASPTASPTPAALPQSAPLLPPASPDASQPVASQPISLPVPDLSQSQAADERLEAGVVTDQLLVPSYLTANLTAAALPIEPIEQPAQPEVEVQRFLTNSQLPPCAVTPEAVYFLGQTVVMRVTTDAAGQVMQTFTERSSRNLAYDELASCLVRNWSFKPAIAQGQAVANPGLVVRITIDRS